jgi:hypothetical protein
VIGPDLAEIERGQRFGIPSEFDLNGPARLIASGSAAESERIERTPSRDHQVLQCTLFASTPSQLTFDEPDGRVGAGDQHGLRLVVRGNFHRLGRRESHSSGSAGLPL